MKTDLQRAAVAGIAAVAVKLNGLMRAIAKCESIVVIDGNSARYQGSTHDSVWNKWAFGQFGWYRMSLITFVP
ncbi:hypothetical protein SPSYN_01639 [Sporotomaculum syntrophicum]|uniref:Uncharacterized protein n=1 Tax=Sporotomaculum syntrophicum TaxID=182264 RepID=A0A9D3AXY7_9FIRM|nr:hypothetical protein SPSYN_01639 [Sporotomaculum syntrophicum]